MELNYQESGQGVPLIVMHGLFGSISNWKGIARRLSDRCRVITVDLRNHGASPWHEDVSYPAMAADIAGLIGQLGLRNAALLGHSMGGKVAMTLALTRPEIVRGLVVVDIAPVTYDHSHEALIETMLRVDLDAIRKRQDLDAQLEEEIADPGLRMFLGQNLVFGEGRYEWRVNLAALARGMDKLTGFPDFSDATYPGPAEFVYGEASDYVTETSRQAVYRRFPDARLDGVEGAGHWVHAQAPGRVVDAVHSLLGRLPPVA